MNVMVLFVQEGEGQGGDQDQEERRWNKRTQQMLHGLQVWILDHFRIVLEIVNFKTRVFEVNGFL